MSTLSISFEHEEKKRQEELLSHYFKLKAPRECRKTNINLVKIDIQWRNLLREAKIKELKCDIENMREAFQRTLDHKEAMIDFLRKELSNIEIQRVYNVNAHMHNLKNLFTFEEEQMQTLRLNYIKDRAELRRQFVEVQLKMVQNYKEKMTELDNMAYNTNVSLVRRLHEERENHLEKIDFIENMGEQNRVKLDFKFDWRVERIWQDLQTSFLMYLLNTTKRSKMFLELKAKHEETVDRIKKKQEDLETLNETVSVLNEKIKKARKEHKEKIENLKVQKDALWACKLETQQKMKQKQQYARKQLVLLVNESHKVQKHLEKHISKGHDILKQAKLCRTFEDERSEYPPVSTSFLSQADVKLLKKELFTLTDQPVKDAEKVSYSLDQFWVRFSNVAIQNMALEKELVDLHAENKKLQRQVRTFLTNYRNQSDSKLLPYASNVTSSNNTVQEATDLIKYI